ncbi:glycoside hydrolase family 5 protein [Actimicrobium sp. CCI2.3]|uniref:glycoside hydrolase family 5 protein n=1 Tax=Actimicrobium sp. CCI2.3 TaxID=3048616 RepID=UPI002B24DA59|nr:glycoside hydrolase family 5 protein [Actimicrobium sp. CCI2.3]MEB0021502.1 glycoside hydrolase family 5 protein [Actimicrobium sp. CCI2.3]
MCDSNLNISQTPTLLPASRLALICLLGLSFFASAAATSASLPVKFKGVNISGGEYNGSKPNGRLNYEYTYPANAEIDYYAGKGMNVIRVPFSGARIQPINNAALSVSEIANLQKVITYSASKGVNVILDPHDYGSKYDSVSGTMKLIGVPGGVSSADFADFWKRLAIAFKSQPNVIFALMNEPNQQTPVQWKAVASDAVAAIRSTGATQKILIPGTSWTGAHSWVSSGNAAAWTGFTEPANNFAFEVHQYLDSNNSGTSDVCVLGKGKDVLNSATLWARTNHYELFLAEAGWSKNATCLNEGAAMMNYTSANADVWAGWTYWSGGSWWPQTYMYLLTPASLTSPVDKPQMGALLNNL